MFSVIVDVVVFNPFPLVCPFVRAFLTLESPFHGDPRGGQFSWHLKNHTTTLSWLGKFPQYQMGEISECRCCHKTMYGYLI